jgi:hypothetical protein
MGIRLLLASTACMLVPATGPVAYLPRMRELSSSCLNLLSWLSDVKVDSICFRMSLVDCTFFWLLLAKFTDVTFPPVIFAAAARVWHNCLTALMLLQLLLMACDTAIAYLVATG